MKILSIEKCEVVNLPYKLKNFHVDAETDSGLYGFELRQYKDKSIQLIGDQFKFNEVNGEFEEISIFGDMRETIENQIVELLNLVNV